MSRTTLVAALFVLVYTGVPAAQSLDQRPALWRKLEEALIKSDAGLYNLSRTFFPPTSWGDGIAKQYTLTVGVVVERLNDSMFVPGALGDSPGLCCSTNMGYCTVWVNCDPLSITLGQPGFEAGSTQISKLLSGPDINAVFTAFDPAFYYLMKKLSDEALELNSILTYQEIHIINFYVDQLSAMPSSQELYEALTTVLTWVSLQQTGRPCTCGALLPESSVRINV